MTQYAATLRMSLRFAFVASLALIGACRTAARAQSVTGDLGPAPVALGNAERAPTVYVPRSPRPAFTSRADSLSWMRARANARAANGFHIVVSIHDRLLWVLDGTDTIRTAPVAVGMGMDFEFEGRRWRFETPRGLRRVRAKDPDPVWTPPEWHYAEVAQQHGLRLKRIVKGKSFTLADGRRLVVRGDMVGLLDADASFTPMRTDEHIVFDGVLYMPPIGTNNRQIPGELGRFRLDLGDGYLLHGTPHQNSIGLATTHGCVRLRDEDIAWLYENIPIGTRVYLY